jgi:hypothetical protein
MLPETVLSSAGVYRVDGKSPASKECSIQNARVLVLPGLPNAIAIAALRWNDADGDELTAQRIKEGKVGRNGGDARQICSCLTSRAKYR